MSLKLVTPRLSDPRIMLCVMLTLYTVLGQTVLYFNRDLTQLAATVACACLVDMALSVILKREIIVPLSAYITGLSIGLILESYDWRVFAVAAVWGIASKYFLRDAKGDHFFNPSNFAIVITLALSHGLATVAPGSQWGGKAWIAVVILGVGLMMMKRVRRFELVSTWLVGYVVMSLLRMAAGQGGIVFALGPMAGGEFVLFSFSMLPDPKTSPRTRKGQIFWAAGLAVMDGVMRYLELRYSMFIALFTFCAVLPLVRRLFAAERPGAEPWKTVERVVAR